MINVAFIPSTDTYYNLLKDQVPTSLKQIIQATNVIDDADFIVVWDKIPDHLLGKISNKKCIFIGAEPPHIFTTRIDESFFFNTFNSSSYNEDFLPAIWWIGRSYEELKSLKLEDLNKTKNISCITTNKWRKRAEFVKLTAGQIKDLEVFGRWIYSDRDYEFLQEDAYKGPINGLTGATSKSDGLEAYHYSLCIENTCIKNYWTEKIIDSILSWTFPIYCGAPNICDFFPQDSFISINMDRKSINVIKSIIEQPPSRLQIEALSEARRLILDDYNVWVIIYKLINGDL